ncbi:MAG: ABC transporter substrate-binding protein [Rhodospirillales bacterium]
MKLKFLACCLAMTGAALLTVPASAQISDSVVKIGMLDDMSGPFSDYSGPGAVEAMKLAVEDFGGNINGKKIELLTFDHQNKADLAANKAREWYDEQHVDLVISHGLSSAGLAITKVALEKHKLSVSNSGAIQITNEQCSPYTVRFGMNTVNWARSMGKAIVEQGGKTWFFISLDSAFGTALQADTQAVIEKEGGTIVGTVRNPAGASDFAAFMLQALASKAQILGLANAGSDLVNAIKAANEFGVTKTMKLAGWIFPTDVDALGLNLTKNMYMADAWYWDQDEQSRAWSKRYFAKMGRMPTSQQAVAYSVVFQFLTAVKATGKDDADSVLAYWKSNKLNDMYIRGGELQPDGSIKRDLKLFQVKTPEESKGKWDYFKILQSVPGDAVYLTKAETKCQYWK